MTATMTNPPKAARFWNFIAKKCARDSVADQAAYEKKLAETAKRMTPDMDVLEFGCGTGTTALIHAARVSHIDAVDFSYKMIEIARGKANGVENVDFHVSPIENWAPWDPGYGMVMTHSVLHLVDDLTLNLEHIGNHLKPNGYFVSSTVCLRDTGWFWPLVLPVGAALRLIPKVRPLTAPDLVSIIESAGFEIEMQWQTKSSSIFIIARKL